MAPPISVVTTLGLGLLCGGAVWTTQHGWWQVKAATSILQGAAVSSTADGDGLEDAAPLAKRRELRGYSGKAWTVDIMIFGLYNTGTNRLQSLLHAYYPAGSICPDTKGHWGAKTCKGRGSSKHGSPQRVRRWLRDMRNRHRHVVLTVRDPFSNLLAILREPYQLKGCVREGMSNWLTKRCKCSKIGRPDPVCRTHQKSYSSIVAIYNTYIRGALYIAKRHWPGRTGKIIINTYEKFFLHPAKAMRRLRKRLRLPLPKQGVDIEAVLSKPAKANDVPYPKRVQTVATKSYLGAFSSAEIRQVCRRLDRKAARKLGYGRECR